MSLTGGYPRFSNASDDAKSVEARPAWYPAIIQKGSTIYSARYCQTSSFRTIITWNYTHLKMISWNPLSNNIIRACIFRIIIPSDPITLQLSEHSGAYLLHRAPNVQWSQRALTTPWTWSDVAIGPGNCNPVAMWRCHVWLSGSSNSSENMVYEPVKRPNWEDGNPPFLRLLMKPCW
jgi:hypothetical protein